MLDVRRLRVLREVAHRGSFSAAAEALHFTQSAVSQQIAALEREAGTQLVDRSARGVRLTQAGEALVRHTDVILARLADAEAELDAIAGVRGGRLRLASFPSAGASLAPAAIARFRERHPGVELTMVLAEPPVAIEQLRAGDVDVALLIDTPWEKDPDDGVERVHILDDPMYVCLPAGHPQAARRRVALDDLAEDAWMMGSRDTCPDCTIFLRECDRAGFEPRIGFYSDDYQAIQGFVAAGMGVAIIPDLALATVRDDVVVRAIAPKPPVRRIVVGALEGRQRSPAAGAMMDTLIEVGRELSTGRPTVAVAV